MAVRKTAKGAALKRWFKEDWKDVSTGKACGRKKGDGRSTPYCRPSKRVSSKTPKTSGEMTAAQKKSRIAQKKSLGQPAGKPRRVASLTRRNIVKKMNEGGMLKSSRLENVKKRRPGSERILTEQEKFNRKMQRAQAMRKAMRPDGKIARSKKMNEGGMLKAVPEDKKKSLGKLPTPVREKMGFMKEGGNVNKGRRKRGVPTSDLGGSRMRASKSAEQPRSRSALAELGGTVDRKSKSPQPKKMKEGGIVDRQYLKGK